MVLPSNVFGAYGAQAICPGHRNQFDVGMQESGGKLIQIDADYFWKIHQVTHLISTYYSDMPIAFPIDWRESKIDGFRHRFQHPDLHGFQAYTTLGHHPRRAFLVPRSEACFQFAAGHRSVSDRSRPGAPDNHLSRYQYKKNGPWTSFTWRFDSGAVAGAVTDLADVLALDADRASGDRLLLRQSDFATSSSNHFVLRSRTMARTRWISPRPGLKIPIQSAAHCTA